MEMYLRCLGQPALISGNGDSVRFRTKKHLALLVFLVVESRRPHRRDRLAELLWSHAQPHEARHSLATALSVLRSRIGHGRLQTTRETASISPGSVRTDIGRLLSGEIRPDQITVGFEVEPFLEGFDIPGSPEFGLWKDSQQARLLPALKNALLLQLGQFRRTGDAQCMEQIADRMLSLDELSEEAIRAKMESRALAGDRLTALRVFDEWKERLERELRATPSELVEGMAVRLRRRGWERTARSEIPPVRTDHWRDQLFVGRKKEYQELYGAWEVARQGRPTQVLVQGDSGVGKTTLIERIATSSALEGAVVSRTQCYDLDRELPYAALGMLTHGLLDSPGISGTPPESLAELARTIPEVRRRFPSIPDALVSHGETARIRLAESFFDMLQAISEEHPLILIIDDVHQADDASLAVLQLVMRRSGGLRILVILATRLGDVRGTQQRNSLVRCDPQFHCVLVEIGPMSLDESRALLEGLTRATKLEPSQSVQAKLISAAAGVPMVLELLYHEWAANGDQSLGLSLDSMTSELSGSISPPTFYADILSRLVRALAPSTLSVLNLAAVLGPRLNDVSLYEAVDLTVGGTMSGMTELVARRVLRDGGKGLEFANELVRAAAYLAIPSPLRCLLHTSIADRLIASDREGVEGLCLEIAWHCIRGQRTDEGTGYLMRGAKEALRVGAPLVAERALSSAIPILEGAALNGASLLLAEVLHELGRSQEVLDLLSSYGLAERGALSGRAVALSALAKGALGSCTAGALYDELPQLEEVFVANSAEPSTMAMAGRAMAYIVGESRDSHLAFRILQLLEPIRHDALDADAFGQLALSKALLLYNTGSVSDARSLAIAGVEELERRRAANLVMVQLRAGLGTIASRQGLYAEAIDHFRLAEEIAVRLGNDRQVAMVSGNIALCCGRLGRFVEQLDWVERAPKATSADLTGFVEIQLAYCSASAFAWLGDPVKSREVMTSLERRLSAHVPPWMLQGWGLWKADILMLLNMHSEAMSHASRTLENHNFQLRSPAFAGPFARWISRVSTSERDRKRATTLVGQMVSDLVTYDQLDQVEILCSWILLAGGEAATHKKLLRKNLDGLPPTICDHLSRQGVLPSWLETPTELPLVPSPVGVESVT